MRRPLALRPPPHQPRTCLPPSFPLSYSQRALRSFLLLLNPHTMHAILLYAIFGKRKAACRPRPAVLRSAPKKPRPPDAPITAPHPARPPSLIIPTRHRLISANCINYTLSPAIASRCSLQCCCPPPIRHQNEKETVFPAKPHHSTRCSLLCKEVHKTCQSTIFPSL